MKTWADLKHGDVIDCSAGTKGTVIDVLPHSAFIRFNTYDEAEEWYSFDDLELRGKGWQIVQPKDEEKTTVTQFEWECPNCHKMIGAKIIK